MCMVAVMSESWDDWFMWTNVSAPKLLLNPSLNGKYLRINTLSWIVENKIDVATLRKEWKYPPTQTSSKCTNDKVDSMLASAHMYDTSNQTSTGPYARMTFL